MLATPRSQRRWTVDHLQTAANSRDEDEGLRDEAPRARRTRAAWCGGKGGTGIQFILHVCPHVSLSRCLVVSLSQADLLQTHSLRCIHLQHSERGSHA